MQSKSIIVGTAGHIDHGKTSLVKALTGIDADRLEEEKRRGITIDIGFAHMELQSGGDTYRLGFVDVPGHERFVRNMLAGIGGIDLVLLEVAADEGIMPQTREHFDICRLLSIQRGITVLTKADLVDKETLDVVRMEVEEFVRGSFLDSSRSPIIAVSSTSGEGLPELRQAMAAVAAEVQAKTTDAPFRLPIDRVFTMKGFGTVITGTLVSGSVAKEDEVEVFPSGSRARVRSIQVHDQPVDLAVAGQRTALNLAGVEKNQLSRGMTLASPGLFRTTREVDVELSLLKSARTLKQRSRVHLHAFTSESVAEVRLLGVQELRPGQTTLATLKFAEPMLLLPGDRFIVRQFSPVVTIGGGQVIDALPLGRRRAPEQLEALRDLLHANGEARLLALVERRGSAGLPLQEATAETGWSKEKVRNTAGALIEQKKLEAAGDLLVSARSMQAAGAAMQQEVVRFHKANPLTTGISREQLRERLKLPQAVFEAALQQMAQQKALESSGEQVRLPGRSVVMNDEEAVARKKIESAFASAGLRVPALKDVMASLPVDKVRAQKIVTLLLREKVLIKLADDLVFHRSALESLRALIMGFKGKSNRIDVAAFKELTGVSRKYAIPLLEYLDRERVTRREGDARVIL
jgi:selenocysteine-specific elongation factor